MGDEGLDQPTTASAASATIATPIPSVARQSREVGAEIAAVSSVMLPGGNGSAVTSQRGREFLRGREPVGRQLLERAEHRAIDVRRNRLPAPSEWARGRSVSTFAMIACAVPPRCGGSPVSIS